MYSFFGCYYIKLTTIRMKPKNTLYWYPRMIKSMLQLSDSVRPTGLEPVTR